MMRPALTMPAVAAAGFLLLSSVAQACSASGQWDLVQTNGATVGLDLDQEGSVVRGTAYEPDIGTGRVRGHFTGDRLSFDVYWPNGSVGAYRGRVTGDDFIRDGFTYDRRHPGSRAAWHSTQPMDCSAD